MASNLSRQNEFTENQKGTYTAMPVTIKDVARHAGVSQQTVSNVINHRPVVRKETRKKVLKACKKLGYLPNAAARSLVTRKSHILGLLLVGTENPKYGDIINTMTSIADRYGYSILVGSTKRARKFEVASINSMLVQQVDGIMLAANQWDSISAEMFQGTDTQVTYFLNHPEKRLADYFGVDNYGGMRQATTHLLSLGHTHLAFVRGPNTSLALQREQGFRDAIKAASLPSDKSLIIYGGYTVEGGYQATLKALQGPKTHPTAIVFSSDMLALGAFKAAHELGMDIPRDLAIIGFDNCFFSSLPMISMTTVGFDLKALGEQTIHHLVKKIVDKNSNEPTRYVTIPCELIVRRSCGAYLKNTQPPMNG